MGTTHPRAALHWSVSKSCVVKSDMERGGVVGDSGGEAQVTAGSCTSGGLWGDDGEFYCYPCL